MSLDYICHTTFRLMNSRILIADDEPDILEIIQYNLQNEGYTVFKAKDGNEALDVARKEKPDLIILDVMMPRKTGIEVCKILRTDSSFRDTLIIFLTALNDETAEIKGLESGADDYLTKPISPKILLSKVNALFRRINNATNRQSITVENMQIDPERFVVSIDTKEMVLPRKEFELLYLLASRPGKVFLRHEILSRVWGNDVIVGDRTIDVHIRKVRQKLDLDCITTVKGVGYKFQL